MHAVRVSRHQARAAFHAPLFISQVPAGFPSPADDYMDKKLDLNEHFIKHPEATFYCRVSGQSMTGAGIFDGDLLIVDRAVNPAHGDVILAALNGELTCKILDMRNRQLLSASDNYPPLPIEEDSDFQIEGVVINSIRSHRVCSR
ncbi:MAG: translesion error-prone DNA polymerase V autoproteolytic subunit [Gammaproteobacteria bacterium]|jgi:DNA polymerase V|nr:DNA polymerase V [Chromatiales bacterium]MDP6673819.1 translesion error-prone DNA polymerase V autoproteolytic subunit [Gammaproteobacteria bacterium]